MNIPQIIRKIKRRFFSKKHREARKRQRFLLNIIGTNAFTKLTPQDKIVSLAKLIALYRYDFGNSPRKLEVILLRFNNDLSRELSKN